ncbi:Uncharacterised protein [Starkeya nomas]|uniref:Uncharacterized protein n=1 Tax=Starkeya nomas TaxID=2666134 RepID=A0A5S9R6J3_9HYPH|nr:Uncharacterised protein [Starkeya nomas]
MPPQLREVAGARAVVGDDRSAAPVIVDIRKAEQVGPLDRRLGAYRRRHAAQVDDCALLVEAEAINSRELPRVPDDHGGSGDATGHRHALHADGVGRHHVQIAIGHLIARPDRRLHARRRPVDLAVHQQPAGGERIVGRALRHRQHLGRRVLQHVGGVVGTATDDRLRDLLGHDDAADLVDRPAIERDDRGAGAAIRKDMRLGVHLLGVPAQRFAIAQRRRAGAGVAVDRRRAL